MIKNNKSNWSKLLDIKTESIDSSAEASYMDVNQMPLASFIPSVRFTKVGQLIEGRLPFCELPAKLILLDNRYAVTL